MTRAQKEIAERLQQWAGVNGKSQQDIADMMGCNRSTVSRYFAGTYEGDVDALCAKALEIMGEEQAPLGYRKPEFFESRDAKAIVGLCASCQEFGSLGAIVGRTGQGKTHTLRWFAKKSRVALIECDDTMSCRDMVEAIEGSLGIPSMAGTIRRRVKGILDFFEANPGYLLIIDEADKLISKYSQKKLEVLRAIFDQAKVGLVIAGEPALEMLICAYLPRFANRVDFIYRMVGLNRAEVGCYLKGLEFTPDAMDEMVKRATASNVGCFRLLDRTLNNLLRLFPGKKITMDCVTQASQMMML